MHRGFLLKMSRVWNASSAAAASFNCKSTKKHLSETGILRSFALQRTKRRCWPQKVCSLNILPMTLFAVLRLVFAYEWLFWVRRWAKWALVHPPECQVRSVVHNPAEALRKPGLSLASYCSCPSKRALSPCESALFGAELLKSWPTGDSFWFIFILQQGTFKTKVLMLGFPVNELGAAIKNHFALHWHFPSGLPVIDLNCPTQMYISQQLPRAASLIWTLGQAN